MTFYEPWVQQIGTKDAPRYEVLAILPENTNGGALGQGATVEEAKEKSLQYVNSWVTSTVGFSWKEEDGTMLPANFLNRIRQAKLMEFREGKWVDAPEPTPTKELIEVDNPAGSKEITEAANPASIILAAYRGSIAFNTYIPPENPESTDDKDVMAVVVPPIDYYFGMKEFGSRGTRETKKDEWDIVVYEARKFIRMLSQGNPNVISLLWTNPKYHIKITEAGRMLLENRHLFVGKHVYQPFVGYAKGELEGIKPRSFSGYMGAKRKALVEKFGYDTKNAAHLIRLLRMGIEFLGTGILQVERHDAQELIEIKQGKWTLEQVKKEADELFVSAEKAYRESKLPEKPNKEEVNRLAIRIVSAALEK